MVFLMTLETIPQPLHTHMYSYVLMPLTHTCTHRTIHTDAHMQGKKKHSHHEKAGVTVLMSDKINTKSNGKNRNKEGHLFICLKRKCV